MKESITITVSVPESVLSPNARCHWTVKSRAVKLARWNASLVTIAAMRKAGIEGGWEAATYAVRWYAKTDRRRDEDNAISSLKAAKDGLVDAGLLLDDVGLTIRGFQMLIDKKNPRVELELRRKK